MSIENEILMHFRSGKKHLGEISLSEPIETDKDGNALELMDTIACEDDTVEIICKRENFRQIKNLINEVLDEREREIIVLRFGLDNAKPRTQREVAKYLDISRSYVSRIEKKAIGKIRELLK